ncbi:LamG-like jellyroll fold domain-containing protein [Rufibacter immobilis]|uniref:LamG-like jellyroll fold domain-containing protein n=1 Tax=Rufibacter immobilis TaxID=1348778 RepID=UPI0035EB4DD1
MMKRILTLLVLLSAALSSVGQVANKAAAFAGVSTSKASFGNIQELNGATQFTFEAWVYIDQWTENSYIFSKIGSTTNRIDIQLGTFSNKRLYFHVANNANIYAAADNSSITVGKWHHLTMAYDGSLAAQNQLQVLIDGEPVKIWFSGGNGLVPTSTPVTTAEFELGRGSFAGKIDEARLWNVKLSAAELELKNTINPNHPLYANLVAYWKLDREGTTFTDEKGSYPGTKSNVTLAAVTDNPVFQYRVVSSYIRSNFYETGRISQASLKNNNDLIYLAANTYANGDLFFEYPENHGTLTNASHLASFASRTGVLDFGGTGASMNAGEDLLNKPTGGASAFTFATWVYIDQWVENSYLFRKQQSASQTIDLQLTNAATKSLVLHLANGTDNYATLSNSGLEPGQWHHVAVTYNGNGAANQQVKLYLNGVSQTLAFKNADGLLPKTGPFIRSDFELGVNFDGKLDETSLNLLSLSASEINTLKNNPIIVNSWNPSKTNAYWKYDDASAPGKDSRTWVGILKELKALSQSLEGVAIRIGVSGGDWKTLIKTEAARQNFANNIKNLLETHQLDGVDFDFEWCETDQEWADYSATILTMNNTLPPAARFTVSLHPAYYKITPAAIAAADYISIQSYGPRPNRFPYDQYVADISSMIAYGYPRNKLIMGLPFYGAAADNSMGTVAYFDIVKGYPTLDPTLDEVTITTNGVSKAYVFNGQATIIKKAKLVREEGLAGVMYWDLATDVDYPQQLSLLRALNSVINANLAAHVSGNVTGSEGPIGFQVLAVGKKALSVYPNPTVGRARVRLNSPENGPLTMAVVNVNGKTVKVLKAHKKGLFEQEIDLKGLPVGMYFLRVTVGSTTHTAKIKCD